MILNITIHFPSTGEMSRSRAPGVRYTPVIYFDVTAKYRSVLIEFNEKPELDTSLTAKMTFLVKPGYDITPGTTFTVREGSKIVGIGSIL